MKHLQQIISRWQRKVFGHPTVHFKGMMNHLKEEVKEIETEVHKYPNVNKEELQNELADAIILIVGLADAFRIDLTDAVHKKMSINKKRKWGKPTKDGIIHHED